MDDSQLLKGVLEGCVLAIIAKGETYGYEIIAALSDYGLVDIRDGTLYPVLVRLEKREAVITRTAKSPLGPKRKYFSISKKGIEELEKFKESFRDLIDITERILSDQDVE